MTDHESGLARCCSSSARRKSSRTISPSHVKVPRHVVFAELPKTSTGKIQKHVLRSQAKGE